MLIGVVGAPNKGKSTFFSAATMVDAQIANYPFTTITPNRGVTYVRSPCPHVALGLPHCNPKNSKCVGGTRLVPVNIIDVPGLVPEAHMGKGLGNRFLDSVREADALIQVVDATGRTDLQGNPCEECAPEGELAFLRHEIAMWIAGIIERKGAKHASVKDAAEALSGLKISERQILDAAKSCGLDVSNGMPDAEGTARISMELVAMRMPVAVACNKMDVPCARENFKRMRTLLGASAFPCSAAVELALRKAKERGIVDYVPGSDSFAVTGSPDARQKEALDKMGLFLKENGGSGVQQAIDWVVYEKLCGMVVYPVEDEHRYSNHKGEVLPDALLVPKGTTAHQLAGLVHTDLAQKFIGAIDAKRHVRVGADHPLENGDVVKILASH